MDNLLIQGYLFFGSAPSFRVEVVEQLLLRSEGAHGEQGVGGLRGCGSVLGARDHHCQ